MALYRNNQKPHCTIESHPSRQTCRKPANTLAWIGATMGGARLRFEYFELRLALVFAFIWFMILYIYMHLWLSVIDSGHEVEIGVATSHFGEDCFWLSGYKKGMVWKGLVSLLGTAFCTALLCWPETCETSCKFNFHLHMIWISYVSDISNISCIYLCACLLVCSFVVSLLFHYIQKMVYTLCITNFTFYTQLDFVVLHHLHPIMTLWHIIVSCIHYILSHAIDHISYIGSHCAIQYSTSIS